MAMVIMSNTIQAGWDFGKDDSITDSLSIGTTSSFNRNEIPRKNDEEPKLLNNTIKTTQDTDTNEEGWTTTSPGKKKPKDNNNNKTASTESIITSIDGNFDLIDAGMHNRITVASPGRKYRCNVPDDSGIELEFNPTMMTPKRTGNGKEQSTEKLQESGEETDMTDNQNNNKTGEGNNEINANGKGKNDDDEKTNKEVNNNNNR
jgi:hypothetical protein